MGVAQAEAAVPERTDRCLGNGGKTARGAMWNGYRRASFFYTVTHSREARPA